MSEKTNEALIDSIIFRSATDAGAEFGDPGLDIRRERAEALARMSPGWQPIKTAPKDGTRVLLFIPAYTRGEPVRLGAWAESEQWWRTTSGSCPAEASPTRWMPLPAPPTRLEPPQ